MEQEARIEINSAIDIVTARQKGRGLAMDLGFEGSDLTLIATAISEIARNIIDHAEHGEICLMRLQQGSRRGLAIIAQDQGPGIPNVPQAMQYGYSSRRGLGVGLPGAKSLMDEFDINTQVGKGTVVVMKKWLR